MKAARRSVPIMSLRTIFALVLREMTVTYGRSPGGYLWAILEPVAGIALLSYVFSLGFRTPPLGTNFPIFFATGVLPFIMYNSIAGGVATAVTYSRSLLNYPRVTYMDAIFARAIIAAFTQMLVMFLLILIILNFYETRTIFIPERAIMAICMTCAFSLGMGLFNCFLMTMFPLYQRLFNILTRPLFLLSGVIFLYEGLPRVAQNILWYNPLMHITGEMRGAFYLQYEARYVEPAYVFAVSLVLALLGVIMLHRYHRDMLER